MRPSALLLLFDSRLAQCGSTELILRTYSLKCPLDICRARDLIVSQASTKGLTKSITMH